MSETPDVLTRLRELERRVANLATRLEALESERPAASVAEAASSGPAATVNYELLQGVPALVGRTLVVLGGAFLLRSLAESGALTPAVSLALGVAYALVWLLFADRAAARGLWLGGAFHAVASATIVFPLLVEATVRFRLVGAAAAAALLAVATAAGLVVAWRRDFHFVAWIGELGALVSATILLFRTREPSPFVLVVLALVAASLALAYGRGWRGQRWLVAAGADLLALLVGGVRVANPAALGWLGAGPLLGLQLGLVALYLGAFAVRFLVQGREVTRFAIVQTAVVLLIGFEGALLAGGPGARQWIGAAALLVAVLLAARLLRDGERRPDRVFGYFATVAVVLAAEGLRAVAPPEWTPMLWLAGAVSLALAANTAERSILRLHASLLALAGAWASRLLAASFAAWSWPATSSWPALTPAAAGVLVLSGVVAWRLSVGGGSPAAGHAVARLAVLIVALIGLGALAIRALGAAWAAAPGELADASTLAAVRSGVLAVSATGLALAAQRLGRAELLRLAWAVIVAGGAKLLLEDLRVASARELVFSLGLYGASLIAVPALVRRRT